MSGDNLQESLNEQSDMERQTQTGLQEFVLGSLLSTAGIRAMDNIDFNAKADTLLGLSSEAYVLVAGGVCTIYGISKIIHAAKNIYRQQR